MKQSAFALAALLILGGCASAPNGGWTAREGAQPFNTARSACQEISYGIEVNYTTCMAGRGWTKAKR